MINSFYLVSISNKCLQANRIVFAFSQDKRDNFKAKLKIYRIESKLPVCHNNLPQQTSQFVIINCKMNSFPFSFNFKMFSLSRVVFVKARQFQRKVEHLLTWT